MEPKNEIKKEAIALHVCESMISAQLLTKVTELDAKVSGELEKKKLLEEENKKHAEETKKQEEEDNTKRFKYTQKRDKYLILAAFVVLVSMILGSVLYFSAWYNTSEYERHTECFIEKVMKNKSRDPMVNDILNCNEKEKIDSYFVLYTKENRDVKHVIGTWNNKVPTEGRHSCYKVKQLSENYNTNCIPTPEYNTKTC